MKSILMSIRPEWCKRIFNGSKSIEVRKSRPSLDMPFTVYVYQTKLKVNKGDSFMVVDALNENLGCGKVIGSFVCDDVITDFRGEHSDDFAKYALLSLDEQKKYGGNKPLYGWHIIEPLLFDKPRMLGEFLTPSGTGWVWGNRYLSRPPMSWYYIETDER